MTPQHRIRPSTLSSTARERGISRRTFARASTVAAAGFLLGGRFAGPTTIRAAQDATKVSLALDWYPTSQHAGIYVAQAKGYFTEAGLDVNVYTPADPTTVLQTVGAGRDTFGISYQTDVLFARGEKVPVVSVAALVQHPLNSLMFKQSANITRPADLKGKSVGIAGLPSDDAFLGTMLKTDGLTLDDIEVVNVGYDLLPALLAGRVDAVMGAYWTHESIVAEQQGTPVGYLRVEQWGVPDYYELVLVTGEDYAREHTETVSALLGAIQRGYEDAIVDPESAIATLKAASEDVDETVERKGIDLLIPLWTDNGAVPFGTQTAERWQAYAGWLKEQGLLKDDVDPATAFRGDLLPASTATPAASPQASPTG
ncbi:MAG: ABC transporter substrate-binding protein [Thermomicrobiales bacterium]